MSTQSGFPWEKTVATAAVAFLGYVVYVDFRRRSAPDFKEKLIARRAAQEEARQKAIMLMQQQQRMMMQQRQAAAGGAPGMADPRAQHGAPPHGAGPGSVMGDQELIKRVFMKELDSGQELLKNGAHEGAAERLANAVRVYGAKDALLRMLKQSMPPEAFEMMIDQLRKPHQLVMVDGEPKFVAVAADGDNEPRVTEVD